MTLGRWTVEQMIGLLMKAHYRLMARKDFFYNKRLQEGSKILCVHASDLCVCLRRSRS